MNRFPVVEVFGPTVQGEGALAGVPTAFVRFGGCDYRCSWCDSLHAVLPEAVREAPRMTTDQVVQALDGLGAAWVTLSGGNPALLDLGDLVAAVQAGGRRVAVETQGSVWRDWLGRVDLLTISPKPPSSGMASPEHDAETAAFFEKAVAAGPRMALKIVVFDEADYRWARDFHERWPALPFHMSCGTSPPRAGESHSETLDRLGERYRWLCERAAGDPAMIDATILPQLHVIAWGHEKGR
ncbi:MAG TPA: 7-carboxy-7-deazaguanine synthase QueE [Gaiellales bacterium]|nr:7-carboxy-7-deazaguanine synthase QueE [Gaiellales bacterium]